MHASVCAHAKVNPPLQFISVLQVCLSKPFLNLQLSSSSSPSVCCSTPPPLLFLCERSLGTEPSRVCFLNEYLIRLMRLAGGGASQWSTEREKEGRREGGKERRQKHRTQETGKQPGRGRDLAEWWPCITHIGADLHTGLGVISSSGELPLLPTAGAAQPQNQNPLRGEEELEQPQHKLQERRAAQTGDPGRGVLGNTSPTHTNTEWQEETLDLLCKQWRWRDWWAILSTLTIGGEGKGGGGVSFLLDLWQSSISFYYTRELSR